MMETNLSTSARRRAARSRVVRNRTAFTLTEVLVVVSVIVLLLGVSVPVFKALTGNRSVEAAQNVIAAALGDARAEAVALQKVTGLFFYVDRASQRLTGAMVRSSQELNTTHLLDLVPERDHFFLPVGVGIQFLDNCNVVNGTRNDDGYIGVNPANAVVNNVGDLQYGGVILFDPRGQLISLPYGFHLVRQGAPDTLTDMGKLFTGESDEQNVSSTPVSFVPPRNQPANFRPFSQFGFVLYDAEAFRGFQGGTTPTDPQMMGTSYDAVEQREEQFFLDQQAMPYLVNRYSGALIRGE